MWEALNFEVLKAVAKACKSNNDCQNVCEDPFNALCVNGVCSCNQGSSKESTIHPEAQCCKDGDCTTFAVQIAKSIIV